MTGKLRVAIVFTLSFVAGITLSAINLHAQGTFVYTNNDVSGANTVSAFAAAANGALTEIAGSPFPTGGSGAGGGFVAQNRITVCIVGDFLFVGNDGSNNVSAFSFNALTGALTAVPGSPFATSGTGEISLAATPDGQFLMAGNFNTSDITVFRIAAGGSLSEIASSPFAAGSFPAGMKVSPDGRFLAVVLPPMFGGPATGAVAVLSIAADGSLSPVAGSPFSDGFAVPAGVDINCASDRGFVGEANFSGTTVDVFDIAAGGAVTAIPGSPFSGGAGVNSNVVALSSDDQHLFVSNQDTDSVTVFDVAADGSLSLVAGSPFPVGGGEFFPSGMATNRAGTLLFAANLSGSVSSFAVAADGALTSAPGSPFTTGEGLGLMSVAVFPPKSCHASTNQPPDCGSAAASVETLWPPNHKFHSVAVTGVTDPDGDEITITVDSVFQDEAVAGPGLGGGSTTPDAEGIGTGAASVRSERNGNVNTPGNGRVYHVSFTADDDLGGTCSGEVTVCVPYDRRRTAACVDEGALFDSTTP